MIDIDEILKMEKIHGDLISINVTKILPLLLELKAARECIAGYRDLIETCDDDWMNVDLDRNLLGKYDKVVKELEGGEK